MRQLGTISNERDAHRFAAWLTTQRIDAHAEQASEGWSIWVRDEDHLAEAREALDHFQAHPSDARYQGAERSAEALLRDEAEKRRQSQRNVVEMRGRWGAPGSVGGASRRCPLVLVMIGLSVLVGLATDMGEARNSEILNSLLFVNSRDGAAAATRVEGNEMVFEVGRFDMWANIRKGEVWRLLTPIFVHYGMAHLALNMLWLWSFGGQIENHRGSGMFALLILVLAVSSNVGQAVEGSFREISSPFGGMSGVGYGLFGYVLIKTKFESASRYYLSPGTTFIALLWFVLCIARDFPPFSSMLEDAIPPIANSAHAVGLFVGMAIAYAPLLVRKPA